MWPDFLILGAMLPARPRSSTSADNIPRSLRHLTKSRAISPSRGDLRWYCLQRSLYEKQDAHYLDTEPREQVLITLFEDLEHRPLGVAHRLHEFLGVVSHSEPKAGTRLNRSEKPRTLATCRFLTQPSGIRDLLLPSVPNRVCRFVANRILHHNLSQALLSADLRLAALPLVPADVEQLQILIDRDLSSWVRP